MKIYKWKVLLMIHETILESCIRQICEKFLPEL